MPTGGDRDTAGRHPDWTSKTYYSQWASLSLDNGLLYRSWQAPEGGRPVLKLLVPSIFMPRLQFRSLRTALLLHSCCARLDYFAKLKNREKNKGGELARGALTEAVVRQKQANDSRCTGEDFALGAQLMDVVYQVQLVGGRKVVIHRDRLSTYQPLASTDEPSDEVLHL
ncbi:unnamed protein product [Merluccius merluccius]